MLNLEPIKARLSAATPGLIHPFKTWPLSQADADLLNTAPKDMVALVEEIERLRRDREVDQAQIRSYEAALKWYAAPENWAVQVDDRGRDTIRWRWADDDGRMAQTALATWQENKG